MQLDHDGSSRGARHQELAFGPRSRLPRLSASPRAARSRLPLPGWGDLPARPLGLALSICLALVDGDTLTSIEVRVNKYYYLFYPQHGIVNYT